VIKHNSKPVGLLNILAIPQCETKSSFNVGMFMEISKTHNCALGLRGSKLNLYPIFSRIFGILFEKFVNVYGQFAPLRAAEKAQ
jgi:hypothetical protein